MEKAQKQSITESLESLKVHPGWKIIEKVLDANIKDVENQLNADDLQEGDEPVIDKTEISILRAKRKDRLALKALPDILIEAERASETLSPVFDPYE